MNNKKGECSAPFATQGFSVTSVAGKSHEKISGGERGSSVTCDKYRLTHVTADTGESYLVYFTSATRSDISTRIHAIFTPACAASFAFYRAATRYLEYTLGGCISYSAVLHTSFFVAQRAGKRTIVTFTLRFFERTSKRVVTHEISWKFHQSCIVKWRQIYILYSTLICYVPAGLYAPFLLWILVNKIE